MRDNYYRYGDMPGIMPGVQSGIEQNDPGFANMMQRFYQWWQSFNGNPQQTVKQMLNSGQMSQQQFGQLRQMARQIMGIIPRG